MNFKLVSNKAKYLFFSNSHLSSKENIPRVITSVIKEARRLNIKKIYHLGDLFEDGIFYKIEKDFRNNSDFSIEEIKKIIEKNKIQDYFVKLNEIDHTPILVPV